MNVLTIMEFVVEKRNSDVNDEKIAQFFDSLFWSLADHVNHHVIQVNEDWLKSRDENRVRLALLQSSAYPFDSAAEMERVLKNVAKMWPELADRCDELISSRPQGEEFKHERSDLSVNPYNVGEVFGFLFESHHRSLEFDGVIEIFDDLIALLDAEDRAEIPNILERWANSDDVYRRKISSAIEIPEIGNV